MPGPARLRLAIAQPRVAPDVRETGARIRGLVRRAAKAGAELLLFPECAASGYPERSFAVRESLDWAGLRDELEATASLAGELGLWVALGSAHPLTPPNRPHNSLYLISGDGRLVGRYDKRFLSHRELGEFFTPGFEPLVFELGGLRIGCALCIEVRFAEVFEEYRRAGVDLVLVSSYSRDPFDAILARAHAGLNGLWVALSVPAAEGQGLGSLLIGPSGEIQGALEPGAETLLVDVLDPAESRWEVPLSLARPWRERARAGEIYARPRIEDRRSQDVGCF